ncbi:MAG: sulfatase-like hydrolase/transferase, partial [Acidiferrobacterales bacterium]|nr:sulfatase-like hydrolase/transferase [Acidiferrobacterales bacterium]
MKNRPNILWIVSDHQIHSTLPQGLPRFPLQKKMAEVGIEFTRAYTPLPVCSPARASMLTGLYPHVHGLTENDGRFGGRKGLDTTDWMIQQSLKEAGYRCGWIGKWHLHHQQSAMDFGFEGFSLPGYGYPYRTNEYKNYLNKKGIAPTTVRIEIAGESGTPVGTKIELCNQKNWFDYESGVALFDGPAEAHEAF